MLGSILIISLNSFNGAYKTPPKKKEKKIQWNLYRKSDLASTHLAKRLFLALLETFKTNLRQFLIIQNLF